MVWNDRSMKRSQMQGKADNEQNVQNPQPSASGSNGISDPAKKINRKKRKTHENILMGFLVELIGFEPVASTMST